MKVLTNTDVQACVSLEACLGSMGVTKRACIFALYGNEYKIGIIIS